MSVGIAQGETTIAVYSGKSFTSDSDLRLRQPGNNTNLRFGGVAYEDQSFSSPISTRAQKSWGRFPLGRVTTPRR